MASEGLVPWLADLATELISGKPSLPRTSAPPMTLAGVWSGWGPATRAGVATSSLLALWILWPSVDAATRTIVSAITGADLAAAPLPPARPGTRYTTGLINRGNDCYINSCLQALAGIPGFIDFVEEHAGDGGVTAAVSALVQTLAEPISVPRSATARTVMRALEVSCHAHFSTTQQDAHEFLHLLLERIEHELTAAGDNKLPCRGELADAIVCTRCRATSTNTSSFLVHTIAVPNQSHANLADLLGPQVEAVDGFRCDTCGHVVTVRKTTVVEVPPPILCIHLSRSLYSYGAGSRRNSCAVDIPLKVVVSGNIYELRSTVSHAGTHSSGHYDAARRSKSKHRPWWTISDQRVRQATTAQISGEQPRSYLLFYEQTATSSTTNGIAELLTKA